MKNCPQCGLKNPDNVQTCQCGHQFDMEYETCPNCQSLELKEIGLADAEGRFVAGLLGGRSLKYLIYGRPAMEIRCLSCGFKFQIEAPRRRWTKWDDVLGIGIGLIIILAFVIFGMLASK